MTRERRPHTGESPRTIHAPGKGKKDGRMLAGGTVVITRPAGTGSALAQKVRALGGAALLLPGLSLREVADKAHATTLWRQAQHDDVLVFTSPAAVRYALALAPLSRAHGKVIAVGQGTARALQRHGILALVPASRQDSEGMLAMAPLQQPEGKRIALITAPGGRGLLQQQLAQHGAHVHDVHVYQRTASRLTRRHQDAVQQLVDPAYVLFSSAEALQNLRQQLQRSAWERLCRAIAIVSSERIGEAARVAGFEHLHRAASANQADLLAAACDAHSRSARLMA